MNKVYMVQRVEYGCWGDTRYGNVIAVFSTRDKAEEYVYKNNLDAAMFSGWPTITIREQEIE